jgi:hypothetical protein
MKYTVFLKDGQTEEVQTFPSIVADAVRVEGRGFYAVPDGMGGWAKFWANPEWPMCGPEWIADSTNAKPKQPGGYHRQRRW